MDLQELKRRALTEPDPRVQAQYAEQLVKAAESEKAARPAMKKVASLSLGVPYDTIADAEEFRAMQAPDKYDILHNIEEDKFYAVMPGYAQRMLQNPQRWEYAKTRRPGMKAARPTTRKAARRPTRR